MNFLKLIRLILFFIFLFIITVLITLQKVHSYECTKHPIYCQIVSNKPNINKAYAFELSNLIYKASTTYRVSSRVLTAIYMQESNYNYKAVSKHVGYTKEPPKYPWSQEVLVKTTIYSDFGISQIHTNTIERYKFDPCKLTTDLEYSVNAGAQVLSRIKKRYGNEVNYWSRYNSSSPTKRKVYEILVERYL